MAFEAGRGGSGLEPKLAGLRLTPADLAGRRRRTPQDLGRILAGPGTGPSGPAVLGGPIGLAAKGFKRATATETYTRQAIAAAASALNITRCQRALREVTLRG